MAQQRFFAGAIWTNHALERLKDRGITQGYAGSAFASPDITIPGKNPGTMEYQKQVGTSRLTLIVKKNERHEWIVLSGWIDPPLRGSVDWKKQEFYRKYQTASFWGKMFLVLKRQLGL